MAVLASGGLAAAGQLAEGQAPRLRVVVGGFLAAVLLGFLADVSPDLAGAFAALMLATAVLVLGGPAWNALTRLTSRQRK